MDFFNRIKDIIDNLRKSNEEYHQRVSALETEVYALTSERDTLRIEQNKKDEVISQVRAEGEELSKKQAAQESTISELRAQIREFEEEKKELITKLQVEENNVESVKRDKAATEKLLQETIEKNHAEVFALTSERDTLRIEQNKKDEVISQVRAEGEELSKIQAAQESTISELRAQIQEFEEEKTELITKLQVEENNMESIKRDKTATEKLLQETIEKNHEEVFALTSERDTLRIEQNKKDEVISRVMAEGEELSKKQAAQESTISELRAQIQEFEEEKKELITKLQVEENNMESIKRDKIATEKLLQETIEKNHDEVFALTSERDTLCIEQNKKDEVISRVMAEGEELSKKQAAQESTISELRAQIGEFEEEKKELIAKLQVEENNMECIKRDKAATEKLLQETIEKNHAEVFALTSERDTLRIDQNKKDEVISRVMAEGEELSKKQAAQESTISKLRAQIGEFEEEKKELITKLQVEENIIESIKRDKAATEKLLQETIEKNHVEVATQKEYYINALSVAKGAEAIVESRANELEHRLKESEEREAMLVQTQEELRQTLSKKEEQLEKMLKRSYFIKIIKKLF